MMSSLTWSEQTETLHDGRRDLEGVELGLEELRIDLNSLILCLLNILKHAQRELSLDLLRATRVQTCVKCDH